MATPTPTPTFEDINRAFPEKKLTKEQWDIMPQLMRDIYFKAYEDILSINNAAKGTPIPTPPKKSTPIPTMTATATPTPTPTKKPLGGHVYLMNPEGTKQMRVTAEEAIELIKAGWHEIE
jgi:hypothetical protein